jgi:hypothetical protein
MLCNELYREAATPPPDSLLEDYQTDMERLARLFMDHYIYRCMRYLPQKIDRIKAEPDGLYEFPGAVLRDVFPNRKGLSRFDKKIQTFIKERGNLRLGVERKRNTTNAYYSSPGEIMLFLDLGDYTKFRESIHDRILEWPLRDLLGTRQYSLVHELQHAYDDWDSKGKYKQNKRSQDADWARYSGQPNEGELYLNNPIEISARYRHTVSQLGASIHGPWKDYYWKFKDAFNGWRILSVDDKRRLTKRLAAYWISQHPQQQRDISSDIAAFEQKLRAQYGGYIHLRYREQRNAVCIDSFGTDDPQIKRDILRKVIDFANNRRAMVTTSDMPYSKDMKELGFVNQRTRNRDYALPLGTNMYRPARSSLRAAA